MIMPLDRFDPEIIHPKWPDREHPKVGLRLQDTLSEGELFSILHGPEANATADAVDRYLYVEAEVDPTAEKTILDWHRGGKAVFESFEVRPTTVTTLVHSDAEDREGPFAPWDYFALYNGALARECPTIVTTRKQAIQALVDHFDLLLVDGLNNAIVTILKRIKGNLESLLKYGSIYVDPVTPVNRIAYWIATQPALYGQLFPYQKAVNDDLRSQGVLAEITWTPHHVTIISDAPFHARGVPRVELLDEGGKLYAASTLRKNPYL